MRIWLEKLPDGKWVKHIEEKISDATREDILLWQNSEKEILKKIKNSPSDNLRKSVDVVKWATIIFSILTFFAFFMDWVVVLGRYRSLGIPHLASSKFSEDSIHAQGILYLFFALFLIVGLSTITFLSYRILKDFSETQIKQKRILFGLLAIVLLIISIVNIYISSSLGDYFGTESTKRLFNVGAIVSTSFGWLLLLMDIIKSQHIKNAIRVIAIIFVGYFFIWEIGVTFPSIIGSELAMDVMNGATHYTSVDIVTTEPLNLFSNSVEVYSTPSGKWIYLSQIITNSNTGNKTVSLQYVGTDDEAIYLLDYGSRTIHAVSKNVVEEIVFHTEIK